MILHARWAGRLRLATATAHVRARIRLAGFEALRVSIKNRPGEAPKNPDALRCLMARRVQLLIFHSPFGVRHQVRR
jgi:hypothetical protein